MPIGVVEIRDVEQPDARRRKRRVKKLFVQGTTREITPNSVRTSGWGAIALGDLGNGLDIEYEEVGHEGVANVRRYAPAPTKVRQLLELHGCEHPGLVLDKFIYRSADQSFVRHALQKVVEINNANTAGVARFREVRNRWMVAASRPGGAVLHCSTTGPLTLHLARASALENAGICLHPVYGFAFLPGSGLKGMARAHAETVWLPAQTAQKHAWRQIEDAFGWAPNPDRRQQINDPDHPAEVRRKDGDDPDSPEITSSSGNIVFHDAWPDSWPQLVVDIVNNHHRDYYSPPDEKNEYPPGDWEDPRLVYFLAVKPGTTFTFALTKRRADVADDLLSLARQWLVGALCHLGAGAKTAAGYGAFKPASGDVPALPSEKYAIFEATLDLVTPAFLAGASQQKDDCELRPATVRGLLRWWWRTMHAGFVDVKTLRALEAAIWGDTRASGAVRIVVEKASGEQPQPYDKRSKADFNHQQKRSDHGIPNQDPRKTTQGLWYASYGMDEGREDNRRQRYYLEPGARWRLRLIARPARFFPNRQDAGDPKKSNQGEPITAQQALSEAKAALWLLCHFGGAGSKGRKGFGSLAMVELDAWELETCRAKAKQLRAALALPNAFGDALARSPSLEQLLGPVEVVFSWPGVWGVLDQVGFAYQAFAKKYTHRREKMALGLPRRIGHPIQGTFNPTPPVTTNGRHSSPVHIHMERQGNGWLVRTIAFPAPYLPDLDTSRAFLEKFLRSLSVDLRRRAALQPPPSGPRQGTRSPRQQASSPARRAPSLPRPGERVEAVLLEKKTRKGGWRAQHVATGIAGPVQNSNDVPSDKKPCDSVTLIVRSANEREIAFRYPTPADERRTKKTQGGSQGPSSTRQKGGRK